MIEFDREFQKEMYEEDGFENWIRLKKEMSLKIRGLLATRILNNKNNSKFQMD